MPITSIKGEKESADHPMADRFEKNRLTNNKLHFILFFFPVFPVLVLAGPFSLCTGDVSAYELAVRSGEIIFSE